MKWDGGEETGVTVEITGFQLEQQTTQRWGTTKPCPTADSHEGSVERTQGFKVKPSIYTMTKFSVPKALTPPPLFFHFQNRLQRGEFSEGSSVCEWPGLYTITPKLLVVLFPCLSSWMSIA